jgi:hypothetical protein
MQGFSWPDRRDVEGVVFVRSVRSITGRRDTLVPDYSALLHQVLEEAFCSNVRKDG